LNFSVRKISACQFNGPFEQMIGVFIIAELLQAFAQTIGGTDVMVIDL